MRLLGLLLLVLGIGSTVAYFLEMESAVIHWIGNWGPEVAWAIRGGMVLVGLLLVMAGKKGDKKKK